MPLVRVSGSIYKVQVPHTKDLDHNYQGLKRSFRDVEGGGEQVEGRFLPPTVQVSQVTLRYF